MGKVELKIPETTKISKAITNHHSYDQSPRGNEINKSLRNYFYNKVKCIVEYNKCPEIENNYKSIELC